MKMRETDERKMTTAFIFHIKNSNKNDKTTKIQLNSMSYSNIDLIWMIKWWKFMVQLLSKSFFKKSRFTSQIHNEL